MTIFFDNLILKSLITYFKFRFSDDLRPVKLEKHVLGYSSLEHDSAFRFDMSLNYRLTEIINKYSKGKPVLVILLTLSVSYDTLKPSFRFFVAPENRRRWQPMFSTKNLTCI